MKGRIDMIPRKASGPVRGAYVSQTLDYYYYYDQETGRSYSLPSRVAQAALLLAKGIEPYFHDRDCIDIDGIHISAKEYTKAQGYALAETE